MGSKEPRKPAGVFFHFITLLDDAGLELVSLEHGGETDGQSLFVARNVAGNQGASHNV